MRKFSFIMARTERIMLGIVTALLLSGASLGLISFSANAQSAYPNKPIKIIVPFAPGGGSDFIARLVARRLEDKLKQPVIVENRPGAGGNTGAEAAIRSPSDGYTLFLMAASYAANPSLYKLSFDPVKDVTPISILARGPFIIAVNPSLPVHNLKELVDLAKKPNSAKELSYASAGSGSVTQLATEYFFEVAGISMLHIPYKGTSPALTDTMAGHTQVVFGTTAATLPHVKSGKLRALAVSTPKRLSALPDVPTAIEAGFPGYQYAIWHGLAGPKDLPAGVVEKLNQAIREIMLSPGVDTELASDGLVPSPNSPKEFLGVLTEEIARWGGLVKSRGIKAE